VGCSANRTALCSRFVPWLPRPGKRILGLLKATAGISVFAHCAPFGLSVARRARGGPNSKRVCTEIEGRFLRQNDGRRDSGAPRRTQF
jgi:hypothetical protein